MNPDKTKTSASVLGGGPTHQQIRGKRLSNRCTWRNTGVATDPGSSAVANHRESVGGEEKAANSFNANLKKREKMKMMMEKNTEVSSSQECSLGYIFPHNVYKTSSEQTKFALFFLVDKALWPFSLWPSRVSEPHLSLFWTL